MKTKLIPLFTFTFFLHLASASVPLRWTVETSSANPATFDQFAGATYGLEATLQSRGKPLAVTGDPKLYWQTNGMGSAWWSAPATISGNVLRATWTPACDVGARVYNCFIGITGTVYNAAFQLRLRPSPGALPNELPLPTPVIDFAKVTVLNPPWSGGVDTNTVREIVSPMIGEATNGLRRVDDLAVYTNVLLWTCILPSGYRLADAKSQPHIELQPDDAYDFVWPVLGPNEEDDFITAKLADPEDDTFWLSEPVLNYAGDSVYCEKRLNATVPTSYTLATLNGVDAAIAAHHDETKADRTELDNLLPYWTNDGWKMIDGLVGFSGGVRIWSVWDSISVANGQTLPSYLASGDWNTASDPFAKMSQIPVISETDPAFSNAVLAVGVDTNVLAAVSGLDTNVVAQIGAFYETFADIGITPTQGGMTLAGLLAALVAAVTWLKKKALVGGLTGGVPDDPKLHDFFKKSGSSGRDLKNALLAEAIDVRTPYALTTGDPADRSIKVYNAASLPAQIPLPNFPTAGVIDLEVWIVETAGSDVTGVTFSKTVKPKDGKALEFAKSSTNIVHLTAVAGENYYTAVAAAFAAESAA